MRIETQCLHEGYSPKNGEARNIPIYQSSTYKYESTEHVGKLFDLAVAGHMYSRISNPTVAMVEEKIAALEGGVGALCTTSGQAANMIAVITSLVISVIMFSFGRSIVGWFISGTPQEVAEATGIAYQYLQVMSACLPILYILYVVRSSIQGMGNTVLPMLSGISELFMRTAGVLLLPLVMGSTGIFFAEILAWVGADLILIPSYYVTIKKAEKTFEKSKE